MADYIARRLILAAITIVAISILSFLITHVPAVRQSSVLDNLFTPIGFVGLAIPNSMMQIARMRPSHIRST